MENHFHQIRNKETAIIIRFITDNNSLHSFYEINTLEDFVEICQDYIFDNTNETQKELIACSLNKVDWEAVAKTDRDNREIEKGKEPEDLNIPF